jgi:acetyltransferase-like isoleucine patch superfamily enzyme
MRDQAMDTSNAIGSRPAVTLQRAIRKWVYSPPEPRLNLLYRLARGQLLRHNFKSCRYPLIGNDVWLGHGRGYIVLGSFVNICSGAGISVRGQDPARPAILEIGDRTRIGERTHINCGLSIKIGRFCALSWDCEILDYDLHTIVFEDGAPTAPAPVVLQDHVLLGARSIVLKGVTIGTGSVIGAGSVVTCDIPSHVVAAGNPARVLRTIREWS